MPLLVFLLTPSIKLVLDYLRTGLALLGHAHAKAWTWTCTVIAVPDLQYVLRQYVLNRPGENKRGWWESGLQAEGVFGSRKNKACEVDQVCGYAG